MLTKSLRVAASLLLVGLPAFAETAPVDVTLTLKNHRFIPDTVTAPAGARILVTLINQDGAGEEFDSGDLHVEEDVTPKATIRFKLGPLKAGTYRFMGEAHAATAEGRLIVIAPGG